MYLIQFNLLIFTDLLIMLVECNLDVDKLIIYLSLSFSENWDSSIRNIRTGQFLIIGSTMSYSCNIHKIIFWYSWWWWVSNFRSLFIFKWNSKFKDFTCTTSSRLQFDLSVTFSLLPLFKTFHLIYNASFDFLCLVPIFLKRYLFCDL